MLDTIWSQHFCLTLLPSKNTYIQIQWALSVMQMQGDVFNISVVTEINVCVC